MWMSSSYLLSKSKQTRNPKRSCTKSTSLTWYLSHLFCHPFTMALWYKIRSNSSHVLPVTKIFCLLLVLIRIRILICYVIWDFLHRHLNTNRLDISRLRLEYLLACILFSIPIRESKCGGALLLSKKNFMYLKF